MHIAASTLAASWIPPRLHGFGLDVGSFIPSGFQAYARIFHPPLDHMPAGAIVRQTYGGQTIGPWCVSTEIDFKWTYIGGSEECIAQLLSDPLLEALPVTLTDVR